MTLITRMSRLFKADMHGLLDSLEEPEVVAKQAVREMEEAVARDKRDITSLEAERKNLVRRIEESHNQLEEFKEQLDLCFDSGNEVLAKKFIRKKLECEKFKSSLDKVIVEVDERLSHRVEQLVERESKLERIREKLDVLVEQTDMRRCGENVSRSGDSISEDDIEVAYLAEKRKRRSTESSHENEVVA